MMYAGIDVGSRAIKVVVLNGAVIESGIVDQGIEQEALAE